MKQNKVKRKERIGGENKKSPPNILTEKTPTKIRMKTLVQFIFLIKFFWKKIKLKMLLVDFDQTNIVQINFN